MLILEEKKNKYILEWKKKKCGCEDHMCWNYDSKIFLKNVIINWMD